MRENLEAGKPVTSKAGGELATEARAVVDQGAQSSTASRCQRTRRTSEQEVTQGLWGVKSPHRAGRGWSGGGKGQPGLRMEGVMGKEGEFSGRRGGCVKAP